MNRRAAAESAASLSALVGQQFKALEEMQSGFALSMAQTVKDALLDFERRQQFSFAELEQSLNDRIDGLPAELKAQWWIRRLQVLGAVATLLSLLIALVQFADSKAESNQQAQFRNAIVALMHQAIKNTERQLNVMYTVQRPVMLKEAPNPKSKTVTIIPKDDDVRLIKRKHEWIMVEYIQDSDEEPLYGWVKKKYLKRVR